MSIGRMLRHRDLKPFYLLLVAVVVFALLDGSRGRFLSFATGFGVFETFATLGPVALGLGITMIMREFDLAVAGVFSMAGCIAVMVGGRYPWLGLLIATLAGTATGALQGLIIHRLRVASVGVTLGGLLISIGIAFVLTESASLAFDNLEIAMAMGETYGGLFSIRSIAAALLFAAAALVMAFTRIGRDVIACGSDRHASIVCGVPVAAIMTGAFAFSGACAALSGGLLSYGLASASPTGLADVLVPASTAAIIGGVSLGGGNGRPLGIAAGVLLLGVLRSGFNAIGAEPWVSEVTTSLALLAVAALDAPAITQRFRRMEFVSTPAT